VKLKKKGENEKKKIKERKRERERELRPNWSKLYNFGKNDESWIGIQIKRFN